MLLKSHNVVVLRLCFFSLIKVRVGHITSCPGIYNILPFCDKQGPTSQYPLSFSGDFITSRYPIRNSDKNYLQLLSIRSSDLQINTPSVIYKSCYTKTNLLWCVAGEPQICRDALKRPCQACMKQYLSCWDIHITFKELALWFIPNIIYCSKV